MEFRDAVARRHMVRSYLPRPVDIAAIDRILDAALRAPSAGFAQGIEFIVVTSDHGRAALAAAAGEAAYVDGGLRPWLSVAPVHVVLSVEPEAYVRRYSQRDKRAGIGVDEWDVPYWWLDAGATFMLLLLAAVDEGLAAGFLGSHAFDDLGTIVGLPPGRQTVGLVTIGYPDWDERVGSARRVRRPRTETVHYGSWGMPPGADPAT